MREVLKPSHEDRKMKTLILIDLLTSQPKPWKPSSSGTRFAGAIADKKLEEESPANKRRVTELSME